MVSFKLIAIWYLIGFISRAVMLYRENRSFSVDDLFESLVSGFLGLIGTISWIHEELSNSKRGRNFLNKKLF